MTSYPDVTEFYRGAQMLAMVGLSRIEERFPRLKAFTADSTALPRWRRTAITAWVTCAALSCFEYFEEDEADRIKTMLIEEYRSDYPDLTFLQDALTYVGELSREGVRPDWTYGFWVFSQLTGQDAEEEDSDAVEAFGGMILKFADQWWRK